MHKREAAAYLGVSVRSLERYTKKKMLPCRYERGRIGPRPVYDTGDLDTLKASLEARKTREAVRVESPEAMRTIGFRLDPEYIERLNEQAARHGTTPRAYARQLLVASLEDFRYQELLAELEGLRSELRSPPLDREPQADQQPRIAELAALHDELHRGCASDAAVPERGSELAQVLHALVGLQHSVDRLRADMVLTLEAILLNTLPRSQHDRVRDWVATMRSALPAPRREE